MPPPHRSALKTIADEADGKPPPAGGADDSSRSDGGSSSRYAIELAVSSLSLFNTRRGAKTTTEPHRRWSRPCAHHPWPTIMISPSLAHDHGLTIPGPRS
jgi:hypothetical protein